MPRLEGWEKRLAQVVQRHAAEPFDWGTSDCATLMVDAHEALTGSKGEFGKYLTGYKTAAGSVRRLAKFGFATMGDLIAAHLEEVPPSFARRGDVVIVDHLGADHGAVMLDEWAVGKSEDGIIRVDRRFVRRAFRI